MPMTVPYLYWVNGFKLHFSNFEVTRAEEKLPRCSLLRFRVVTDCTGRTVADGDGDRGAAMVFKLYTRAGPTANTYMLGGLTQTLLLTYERT